MRQLLPAEPVTNPVIEERFWMLADLGKYVREHGLPQLPKIDPITRLQIGLRDTLTTKRLELLGDAAARANQLHLQNSMACPWTHSEQSVSFILFSLSRD